MSAMGSLEAPTAILAATAGIGFAAFGLGKDTHIDLLYKSQARKKERKEVDCRVPSHYVGRGCLPDKVIAETNLYFEE